MCVLATEAISATEAIGVTAETEEWLLVVSMASVVPPEKPAVYLTKRPHVLLLLLLTTLMQWTVLLLFGASTDCA